MHTTIFCLCATQGSDVKTAKKAITEWLTLGKPTTTRPHHRQRKTWMHGYNLPTHKSQQPTCVTSNGATPFLVFLDNQKIIFGHRTIYCSCAAPGYEPKTADIYQKIARGVS